ncbi:cyclic nucleotide-binding domain-containing protein [Beggiatoa alba]|nr:cyclic nucleotide-binding domain-containing protein [Beggiatoa alba]
MLKGMITVEKIAEFPIFSDFTPDQVGQVLSCSSEKQYEKGSILIHESGSCSDIYIIMDGRVGVEIQSYTRSRLNSENKRLALLRAGELVGEMAYIEQRRRAAQVSAFDNVQVLSIDKAELDILFEHNPKIGFLFMRNVARTISRRLTDLNFLWRDDV